MNISGLFNISLRLCIDENSISRVNGLAGKGLTASQQRRLYQGNIGSIAGCQVSSRYNVVPGAVHCFGLLHCLSVLLCQLTCKRYYHVCQGT